MQNKYYNIDPPQTLTQRFQKADTLKTQIEELVEWIEKNQNNLHPFVSFVASELIETLESVWKDLNAN